MRKMIPKKEKRTQPHNSGISPVITTIIISGVLLVILVLASFFATNILEVQIANTEFEQAKTNMVLLGEVVQDVALRRGSGGYVQFNQRSGGIGIREDTEPIKVVVEGEPIYDSEWFNNTISFVYRAGSYVSTSNMTLRGTNKSLVNMTQPLSYLRVETGQGVHIKLDYHRVRITTMGTVDDANYVGVTLIRLKQGRLGGSGTINVKVQNIDVTTTSERYPSSNINIQVKLGTRPPEDRSVTSSASETIVLLTQIEVQVSTV